MAFWLTHRACRCAPETWDSRGTVQVRGVLHCRSCRGNRGSAVDTVDAVDAVDARSGAFPTISTTENVPGFHTVRAVGLVTESQSMSPLALDTFLTKLTFQAASLGADGIVGLRVTAVAAVDRSSGGEWSDAVGLIATGTAVLLRRDDDA